MGATNGYRAFALRAGRRQKCAGCQIPTRCIFERNDTGGKGEVRDDCVWEPAVRCRRLHPLSDARSLLST
jgi:hypothetical protein